MYYQASLTIDVGFASYVRGFLYARLHSCGILCMQYLLLEQLYPHIVRTIFGKHVIVIIHIISFIQNSRALSKLIGFQVLQKMRYTLRRQSRPFQSRGICCMRANSFGLEVCLYEIVYGELTQVLLCCFVGLILPTQCIKDILQPLNVKT